MSMPNAPRVPSLGAVTLVLAVLVAQPQSSEASPQFVNFGGNPRNKENVLK